MKSGDIIEVQIQKLANRGKGLARFNDLVVFVPYSAPGDTLKVEITKVSKSFSEAKIVEILNPSSLRINPPCPHYGNCGGCQLQHINYSSQLQLKSQLSKETIQRSLQICDLSFEWLDPIASPKEWHYRNRIQIHSDGHSVGFMKRNSHQIIDVATCLIAEPGINERLTQIRSNIDFKGKKELYLDTQLAAKTRLLDEKGHSQEFSQVNRFANSLLIQIVNSWIKSNENGHFYDFYCGNGNFFNSVQKNHSFNSYTGVELNPQNLNQIETESKKNSYFFQSSVEDWLARFQIKNHSSIILDPPRIGCDPKALSYLASQPIEQIIYVSCEPTTLARDLAHIHSISKSWNLKLLPKRACTIDLFPQTEHIETIVEFSIAAVDSGIMG